MIVARCGVRPRLGVALLVLIGSLAVACGEAPTPTPPPVPTPRPTPTLSPERVLEGARFSITLDDTLIGVEELHVGSAEDQMIVFAESRWFIDQRFTERRSVIVSRPLSPIRYDLERNILGARSIWAGERRGGAMDTLNNNLAWYGPVRFEGISPAPDVMIESFPSVLPYALLTLRYTGAREEGESEETLDLHALDLFEDHPVSRPLTVTAAVERAGAVIGTLALEGHIEGGRNPSFTLWVRPSSRSLFGVEIPDYRFGFWDQLAHPALREPGKLVIQRVNELPELPGAESPAPSGIALDFTGSDRSERSGTLVLPEGAGPFPCVVVHSGSGVVPRAEVGTFFAEQGWAAYSYDKRGVGESEGSYARGAVISLAEDALAAAAMLAQRDDIQADRIVFLGLGDGGQVGAVALSLGDAYAGAVLGSCASRGAVFPDLVAYRVNAVLAPFYAWDGGQLAAYRDNSVETWQEWLFEGEGEVSLLGRRIDIDPLMEQANTDLSDALAQARAPVLLLHGEEDRWTPVVDAQALATELQSAGRDVTWMSFPGLGSDLGGESAQGFLAPEVERAVADWLEALP